jgi:hypothetical protein
LFRILLAVALVPIRPLRPLSARSSHSLRKGVATTAPLARAAHGLLLLGHLSRLVDH